MPGQDFRAILFGDCTGNWHNETSAALGRAASPRASRIRLGRASINGSSVMLVDEMLEHGIKSPRTLGGTPVTIHLIVPDVDAFVERAVAAGAKVTMPVDDAFWGDRYGVIEDPFGHSWSVATPIKQMSLDEIAAAAESM